MVDIIGTFALPERLPHFAWVEPAFLRDFDLLPELLVAQHFFDVDRIESTRIERLPAQFAIGLAPLTGSS